MREFAKDVLRAIATPVAVELAGAFRDARHKEHEAAIRAREAVAAIRGESERGR